MASLDANQSQSQSQSHSIDMSAMGRPSAFSRVGNDMVDGAVVLYRIMNAMEEQLALMKNADAPVDATTMYAYIGSIMASHKFGGMGVKFVNELKATVDAIIGDGQMVFALLRGSIVNMNEVARKMAMGVSRRGSLCPRGVVIGALNAAVAKSNTHAQAQAQAQLASE